MSTFAHLRARYYDEDPARARALRSYHLSEQQAAGLIATETRHPPGFRIPSHSHDLPSFYLVLEGGLTEFSARSECTLDPHHLVFTPPGHIHRNLFHRQGGRCFLVELTASWTERLRLADSVLAQPVVQSDHLARLASRLYREFRAPDSVSVLSAEGLVLEILAGFARHPAGLSSPEPPWLRQVRELLHDRFAQRVLLSELAASVGVHPVHLSRSFRKRYRYTPGEYQRKLRVEHASRLLSATRRPLAEIALTTGFADQAHFCRVFKEQTGWTPARYRASFTVDG